MKNEWNETANIRKVNAFIYNIMQYRRIGSPNKIVGKYFKTISIFVSYNGKHHRKHSQNMQRSARSCLESLSYGWIYQTRINVYDSLLARCRVSQINFPILELVIKKGQIQNETHAARPTRSTRLDWRPVRFWCAFSGIELEWSTDQIEADDRPIVFWMYSNRTTEPHLKTRIVLVK